jgi:CheY-like chemotaxis protein
MTRRILVVENDPFILELLSDLLPRLGYGVDRAASAAAALQKLGSASFDAVLLDIYLTDMDGRELYQKVSERFPQLAGRIVFMTGDLGNPKTASFIQTTGNLSLDKPFTIRQLKEVMERLFQEKTP